MFRTSLRTVVLSLAFLIFFACTAGLAAAGQAGTEKFSPAPTAYQMTQVDRLTVSGIAVRQIVNVYRDGDKVMVKIKVLPNARNPKAVLFYSVKDLKTFKSWDWGPGVEECTTGSSSETSKSTGKTWGGDPFAEFPMGFRFPSEWSSNKAKLPPGMLRLIGTGTARGFKTRIYVLAIPGRPKEKLWVGEKYGLILKSAHLAKDGHYHPDDIGITRFSLAKPPASVFTLGGPCADSTGSGAPVASAASGIALPHGADVEVKWQDGSALKLKPQEQVAFLIVQDINQLQTFACDLSLKRYCSLSEMVRGVKTEQGLQGLTVDPAWDKNYRYDVGISGKEYAISARPVRPGLGGWLYIQHEFESDCYFNPSGPATGKNKKIGESSFSTDFLRR